MKKRLLGFVVLFLVAGASVMAQQTVSGRVTSSVDESPLPGVSVLVKGTTIGTSTDADGRFTLSAPDNSSVLVLSFIGFTTQEITVGNQTNINVQMNEDTQELGEVVVTAFGLEREKKSLTYTTQEVNTKELSKARELNVVNSLSGKVAGLSIGRSGSGVGSSSRVLLRGNRSIAVDSQPLYIVDGVPAGGITNLNPDDIESINVLKGPNAAALYGNRANNGAIIVTTKKGREGFSFNVNTSMMFDQPLMLTNYQNDYGQGLAGSYLPASEYSWGPRMDGTERAFWSPDPLHAGETRPFTAQPDNVKDFYQTGHNLATTLSVSGGNDKNQTYFSYTFTDAAGVVPNNELTRHSLNLRLTSKLSERLTLDSKINYIRQEIDNLLPQAENFANPNRHAFRLPRNIRTEDISQFEYTTAVTNLVRQNYFNPGSNGGANPYWTINRNTSVDRDDRIMAFSSLNYKLAEGLTILGRVAIDRSVGNSAAKAYADSYVIADFGRYTVSTSEGMEFNADFLASYDKSINDDFRFNINVGGNVRKQRNTSLSSNTGTGLPVRNFFALSNTLQVVSTHGIGSPRDVNSVYGFGQLSWRNAVFLDVTARNDWSSTLPADAWSFFYPSVGINAVVSELFTFPQWFSFAKFRASFAEVGNDTNPFQLERTATFAAGGIGGYLSINTVVPNSTLLPEETRSLEVGTDLRFLHNRLGVDLTYYRTNSLNQLFALPLPVGSGASSYFTNGGDVQNTGFEAIVTFTPLRSSTLNWDVSFNYAQNTSLVKEIHDTRKSLDVASDFLRRFVIEEGKPFGQVYSRGFVRDDQGRVIIEANGLPRRTAGTTVEVANNNPDWLGGIVNSFSYKNFNLSFTVDVRHGGTIASLTNAILYADGLTEETLPGRDGEIIFGENFFAYEDAVLASDGGPNNIPISAELFWVNMGGRNAPIGEAFVVSASNVRMREAVLGYDLPADLLTRTPFKNVSISFVGRNLFFFQNKANNIDPDVTTTTAASGAGYDSFGPPTARSYGFNLNLGF